MEDIEQLGAEIESAWRAVEYHPERFPALAQSALAQRSLSAVLSTERIVRWFALSPQIPSQSSTGAFGEPPIQLYAGRRFYIEALFWTEGTTAIHQHSFSGAFQVLCGGSIHTTYRFERDEEINRDLVLGELVTGHSELLRAGDVRPIVSGDRLIHSLFHLDRPSVTLVVRTRRDGGTGPQWCYLPPGIGFDPFVPDDRSSRLSRLLGVLDHPAPHTTALLVELIERVDLGTVVALLVEWFRTRPVDPEAFEALFSVVERRHRRLAVKLRGAVQEARRQTLIIVRRRRNHQSAHRFFLALVLNVGDRAQILRFVEQQYPGTDPIERIMAWTEELTNGTAVRDDAETGPAEYDLGEVELQVLHHLLRQRTPEQVVASLSEEYDDVERRRPEILSLCASLRNSALFRPLLQVSA